VATKKLSSKSRSTKPGRRRNGRAPIGDENPDRLGLLLKDLGLLVTRAGHGSFSAEGPFRCVVRAALVKAFEFAQHARKEHAEPFFLTATLRGICEDLIVLSFLAPLSDRDEVVRILLEDDVSDALGKQQVFFDTHRTWQPIVRDEPGQRETARLKVKQLAADHLWKRKPLPTVRDMAHASGLVPLYEYIYAATSKWVHCNPGVLLRMGWNRTPRDRIEDGTRWSFSTSNFRLYYHDFNRFYSVFLLATIIRKFIDEFQDPATLIPFLSAIEESLDADLRWPELVTYEEMNLQPPSNIIRVLLRATYERTHSKATGRVSPGGTSTGAGREPEEDSTHSRHDQSRDVERDLQADKGTKR
jgi:hypothetical protein